MKTSVKDCADIILSCVLPVVKDNIAHNRLYNHGTLDLPLDRLQQAVAFDVAEIYGTFEDYWYANRDAIEVAANEAMPKHWVLENFYLFKDQLLIYLAWR